MNQPIIDEETLKQAVELAEPSRIAICCARR